MLIAASDLRILACDDLDEAAKMVSVWTPRVGSGLNVGCRDTNSPCFRGRLPIFVNIFVHFDKKFGNFPISGKFRAI